MSAAPKVSSQSVHLIELPSMIDKEKAVELESRVTTWLLDPAPLHILDFSGTLSIHPQFSRVVVNFKNALIKNEKFLASINLRPTLQAPLKSAGLLGAYNPVESIDRAKEAFGLGGGPAKPKIDIKVLQPFIDGTRVTLETQASLKVTAGKPYLKQGALSDIEIAGVISLNDSDMPGSVAVCFNGPVFLAIYEAMTGEKHAEVSGEIQDAAAEILNMIHGYAKTKLLEAGIRLERAIPVVMVGENLRMQVGERGHSMVLPFDSNVGPFHIEIALSPRK